MKIDVINDKLYNLYMMYESVIWKDDKVKLDIIYENNGIKMLLYNDKEYIDELEIYFHNKERNLYKYIVIKQFISVLGNVMIYNERNIFSNISHKSYVRFVVNDQELLLLMKEIMELQKEMVIDNDSMVIRKLYRQIPYRYRLRNQELEQSLTSRYILSKRILNGYIKNIKNI